MELPRLLEALTDPAAFPGSVGAVELIQTHISAVFLVGEYVYKIKKPVAPGFLDFTTLEKRQHFCQEEVRLNRRLAPDVYLGVVPITNTPDGVQVEAETEGEVVEWAVKMRRLPDRATLLQAVRDGKADKYLVEEVARRIAVFHREAEASERIAAFGRFEVVARNFRDVFERAAPQVGVTVSREVFDRIRALTEETLERLRPLIESRASRGVPRDCHGDLHIDHIYLFPDRAPPGNLVIIDCIEFNEQFRFSDPVADMAFVGMDLAFRGRRDLARVFAEAYFRESGDDDGRALLPLYTAYRAAVRGMVDGLLVGEREVPDAERSAGLIRGKAHWLLTLTELESPARRPCLLLVGGLPGTGKSTLARRLAETAGFEVIRSDVVRKELAGLPVADPSPVELRDTLYSPEHTERTHRECLRRAEQLLFAGRRVIVDATFREERWRRFFLDAAVRAGVPGALFVCAASPDTIRERLTARKGDASDADWNTYLQLAGKWEASGADVIRVESMIVTDGSLGHELGASLDALSELGLHGG